MKLTCRGNYLKTTQLNVISQLGVVYLILPFLSAHCLCFTSAYQKNRPLPALCSH